MAASNLSADAGEFHPIANHWPLLSEPELQRLADDIKAQRPCTTGSGFTAMAGSSMAATGGSLAKRAGIECRSQVPTKARTVRRWSAFVLSQERDAGATLSIDQRAAIAAELAKRK